MEYKQYFVYLLVASLTIASPGPGVVLSIANSIRFGAKSSIPGILGIALGMFSISVIAASGVGTIVMASATAFTVLKYIGAAYLIYLGGKLWIAKNVGLNTNISSENCHNYSLIKRFKEGLLITLSNPKPMVFFIALFPQFINTEEAYVPQFALLSLTFCTLILIIHFGYALFAGNIRQWFLKRNGNKMINRVSSICFFGFALGIVFNE